MVAPTDEQVLEHGQPSREPRHLKRPADPEPGDQVRPPCRDRSPVQLDLPGLGRPHPGDHVEELDLPEPLGPTSPVIRPGLASRLTPRRASSARRSSRTSRTTSVLIRYHPQLGEEPLGPEA